MKHIENNKLIAEFMGLTYKKYPINNYWGRPQEVMENEEVFYGINNLLYHESWDWLMPVVGKITNLINNNRPSPFELDDKWELQWRKLYDYQSYSFFENDITSIYKAIIEFIKWYNLQKEI